MNLLFVFHLELGEEKGEEEDKEWQKYKYKHVRLC